jgi:zinc protease
MNMRLLLRVGATALTFAGAGSTVAASTVQRASLPTKPAADLTSLVKSLDITYSRFTLPNGLRVLVHTDRATPLVLVNVIYDVGSKHEPTGRTGFAHLFEHLMFNGSDNAPSDFIGTITRAGSSNVNGGTTSDLTSYYEEVPVGALEQTLFLESDRMGYLLGAITQTKLDQQRGVVQNEKRQGENTSYSQVYDRVTEGLYPRDHPYGHSVIGSMADLDAARLNDVKGWFRSHYAPNNAAIVLVGDIDEPTARRLVTKYFAQIPSGPRTAQVVAPVPTLSADKSETITDRVAAPMLVRAWAVPGQSSAEFAALDAAAATLGQTATSPLKDVLVRREKLFSELSASIDGSAQGSVFMVRGIVASGVDPETAGRRLDAVISGYLKTGPSADDIERQIAQSLSQELGGLESNNFRARQLGMGELLADDPGFYTKQLKAMVAQTPATTRAAAVRWLGRPTYRLTVMPGVRQGIEQAAVPVALAGADPASDNPVKGTRGALPPVIRSVEEVRFPAVEHTRLTNGLAVSYARATRTPMTHLALSFDAGVVADVPGRLGTQQLTINLLTEGAGSLDAKGIASEQQRLGASIRANVGNDRTTVNLSVPSINFDRALDLLADVTRRPTFAEADVARERTNLLEQIKQELSDPGSIYERLVPGLADPSSPYAKSVGSGDPGAVAALTRADLMDFYRAWLRPDKARLFVVSDRPLAELRPLLERAYGDWRAATPAGTKNFPIAPTPSRPRIALVDVPDAQQSAIIGVIATPLKGRNPINDVRIANEALGGDFSSRINTDLRETRHWTYGAGSSIETAAEAVAFRVSGPFQQDKTADSLAAMRDHLNRYVSTNPITQEEFDRAVDANINGYMSEFSTASSILNGMQTNETYGRPDDYFTTIPAVFRALTLTGVRTAFRTAVDPAAAVWLVVGDADKVRPQLSSLGLPVEDISALGVKR